MALHHPLPLLHLPPPSRRHLLLPTTAAFLSATYHPMDQPKRLGPLKAAKAKAGLPYTPSSRPRYARDVVITFGRYKGRMLGTLPPGYLRWLAEEYLGFFEDKSWFDIDITLPDRAERVLADPVYRDRIEWDPVARVFASQHANPSVLDHEVIAECAERYGWDLDDKEGWSRVYRNRALIGTSFTGRIPRIGDKPKDAPPQPPQTKRGPTKRGQKVHLFGPGGAAGPASAAKGKREERIERMRAKRAAEVRAAKKEFLGINGAPPVVKEEEKEEDESQFKMEDGEFKMDEWLKTRWKQQMGVVDKSLGLRRKGRKGGGGGGVGGGVGDGNPFPGRESLFDKVRKCKG